MSAWTEHAAPRGANRQLIRMWALAESLPNLPGAVCATHSDPDLWHAYDEQSQRTATVICRHCPARRACFEWARDHDVRDGIWGGIHFDPKRRP